MVLQLKVRVWGYGFALVVGYNALVVLTVLLFGAGMGQAAVAEVEGGGGEVKGWGGF